MKISENQLKSVNPPKASHYWRAGQFKLVEISWNRLKLVNPPKASHYWRAGQLKPAHHRYAPGVGELVKMFKVLKGPSESERQNIISLFVIPSEATEGSGVEESSERSERKE